MDVSGGGGGSVGRIRVNTTSSLILSGTISPSTSSNATTTGKIPTRPPL